MASQPGPSIPLNASRLSKNNSERGDLCRLPCSTPFNAVQDLRQFFEPYWLRQKEVHTRAERLLLCTCTWNFSRRRIWYKRLISYQFECMQHHKVVKIKFWKRVLLSLLNLLHQKAYNAGSLCTRFIFGKMKFLPIELLTICHVASILGVTSIAFTHKHAHY